MKTKHIKTIKPCDSVAHLVFELSVNIRRKILPFFAGESGFMKGMSHLPNSYKGYGSMVVIFQSQMPDCKQ